MACESQLSDLTEATQAVDVARADLAEATVVLQEANAQVEAAEASHESAVAAHNNAIEEMDAAYANYRECVVSPPTPPLPVPETTRRRARRTK